MSGAPPPFDFLPHWRQPLGSWAVRGAAPECVAVGLGLWPGRWKFLPDSQGYSPWHYWANGPRPLKLFDAMLEAFGPQGAQTLSHRHEHPWHHLLVRGHVAAVKRWAGKLGPPTEKGATLGGDTLPHCAAWSGDPVALALLGDGELPLLNTLDQQGLTPLIVAVHRGGLKLARIFLLAGADPMRCDRHGRNALHHAAQYGDVELLSLMEDLGGDGDVPTPQGLSAHDLARMRRQLSAHAVSGMREHWAKRARQRLPF